ncbi:MAG: membrane protein insertase YidC [bacterium]|nr:membrane protein insertase YidC [bacterium]
MDRRPIIGFVLIFVIIIGYYFVMGQIYPPQPPQQKPATTESARPDDATASAATGAGLEAAAPTPVAADPAEALDPAGFMTMEQALAPLPVAGGPSVVTVTTPLYRARIETRGGVVGGWELLEHKSWRGEPLQMVPQGFDGGADKIVFRATEMDLATFPYTADQGDLTLAPGDGKRTLTLRGSTRGGLEVRKIFTFDSASHGVTVDLELGGDGVAVANLMAQTGNADAVRFGWNRGIAQVSRHEKQERAMLRAFAGIGEDLHLRKREDLKKDVAKVEGQWRGSIRYAGLQDRYFMIAGIVPLEQGGPVEGTVRLGGNKDQLAQSWALDLPARRTTGGIAGARLELYVGPQQADLLNVYGQGLENAMDLGWKWVRPLSKLVLWGMDLLYKVIPNYGLVIIFFSIVTKLMFYPLTQTSTKSMKKMQELQPKLKALQEKYKNDKEKLSAATMKLYQEEKVNPLSGCWPLLVQSPVFIALYQALSHMVSLRGQPFFGWMRDLSQPDTLLMAPFGLPVDLNVLPFLMGIAMYFQTKFTPTTGGGQMAMLNTLMPVMMVFIFYNMPSGLVLYWFVQNVLQAYQSWRIMKTTVPGGAVKA